MKKILSLLTLMLISVASFAHTWEIRVNQEQDGSLTWYVQSYHFTSETACITDANQSGITINGTNYAIQAVFSGSIVPLSPTVFGVTTSCGTGRNSYGVIHTPYIGGTLSVTPYSNVACWSNCGITANGSFTPPPPPVCSSCPVTNFSNSTGTPNDNGTPCNTSDDYIPVNITVNHLACASITGDGKFKVVFNVGGTNVALGPYNYSTGITTTIPVINAPVGTSSTTQVSVIDDDFGTSGCSVTHGLTIPGGTFNGVRETTPPTISCPTAQTVQCTGDVPAPNNALVTAADNCGTPTVTWEGDAVSNQTCANKYTITRTYKATDASANSATCT
ncbi:MAG: hypothetical protein ABI378_01070, partial [Chitinophagaceae bacterium]